MDHIGETQNWNENDTSASVNKQEDVSVYSSDDDSVRESNNSIVAKNYILFQEKQMVKEKYIFRKYICKECVFILPSEFLIENKFELKLNLRSLLSNSRITRVQIVVDNNRIKTVMSMALAM